MPVHLVPKTGDQPVASGQSIRVTAKMLPTRPVTLVPEGGAQPADFTKEAFEGAIDKVSRSTGRGKLAHLRPNSEEFARRKQEEIDLEERQR